MRAGSPGAGVTGSGGYRERGFVDPSGLHPMNYYTPTHHLHPDALPEEVPLLYGGDGSLDFGPGA